MPTTLSLLLIAAVASATLVGGALPLRLERARRTFLFFSAGTLVGLALLELIPAGVEGLRGGIHVNMTLVLAAFLGTMLLDKLHVLHPHPHGMDEACPDEEHSHPPLAMHGALGLLVHSAVDGLALAAALRDSLPTAVSVAVALSAHKFADGLTTVSLVLSHHHRRPQAIRVLVGNVATLVAGFAVGLVAPLREPQLAALLLVMAGFFLYLGATDLLPSLSSKQCRKRDVLSTAVGMAVIAAVATFAH